MKAYIVYQGCGWIGDWHAMLVREDGQILASHVCSHPSYMHGDLWEHRNERKQEWPDLEVNPQPMYWVDFKEKYPEVFNKAFTVKEETPTKEEI